MTFKPRTMTTLPRRAKLFCDSTNFQTDAYIRSLKNRYHKTDNPEGIINLGISENKLVFDLLKTKLESDMRTQEILEEYTHYGSSFIPRFREAMVNFLNHYMKPAEPVNPYNLVNSCGIAALINVLGFIICDPGEGILIPSPHYGGFYTDLCEPPVDVVPFPVELLSKPGPDDVRPFQLTTEKLEESLEKARKQNIQIRALLLTNPQNPLGDVYSEELIRDCLAFAHRHSLHVIFDEVYMLSIFEEGHAPMKCALSLNDIPDKERVHVVWGFSKDFGLSGVGGGIFHTWNKEVLSAVKKSRDFHRLSPTTQLQLACLVSDLDWIENVYIPTNHRRLRESHGIICEFLERTNIPFLRRGSGLFIWANFREFVCPLSSEGERALSSKLLDRGVFISPGSEFYAADPGWFRIVFASPPDMLRVAMTRLAETLNQMRKSEA